MAARCGTADLAGLATPYGIVPVVRADKGMRNLVKNGVVNVRGIRMADVMSGQGNHPPCVVALAGATSGMVQPDGPAVEAVLAHQLGRLIQSGLKGAVTDLCVSWLHARQAISQLRWPPESSRGPPR